MPFWKDHSKSLTLLLVLVIGIIITAPYLDFQVYLAQGDHGRDLYAAQAVYRGELPYRDFWWVYGPLMPYYYGLFFKIFGVKISSMILGKIVLQVLSGLLMCLAMMEICSATASFLCACWFMFFLHDFFFTYNHIGGIVMIIGIVLCLLSYIQRNSTKSAWCALGLVFALCLIKINFGVVALLMTILSVGVSDHIRKIPVNTSKKLFYGTACFGLPLLLMIIYWSLVNGLSIMEIRQCFPYIEGDQPFSTSPWLALGTFFKLIWQEISSDWFNFILALIINASALRCLYLFLKNKLPEPCKTILLLSFGLLGLFYVLNFHEYLKSGIWYRAIWSQPFSIMLTFLLIDIAAQSINKIARWAAFIFIAFMLICCIFFANNQINDKKTQQQFLSLPRAGIYITNSPAWIATVEQTTNFLNDTLKPNELFFALPYDCIYYYLTGKKTPTRQLIFFEHIKIPPEQEKSVIVQLERNHVNYILLSNRAFSHRETGLGVLGADYCPLIEDYIEKKFYPLVHFGDWSDEPGWSWNHGTFILKRK